MTTRLDAVAPIMATPHHYLRLDAPFALLRDLQRDYDPHRSRGATDRQRRSPVVLRWAVAVEHATEHLTTLEGEGAWRDLVSASGMPALVVERVDRQLGDLVLTDGAHDPESLGLVAVRRGDHVIIIDGCAASGFVDGTDWIHEEPEAASPSTEPIHGLRGPR